MRWGRNILLLSLSTNSPFCPFLHNLYLHLTHPNPVFLFCTIVIFCMCQDSIKNNTKRNFSMYIHTLAIFHCLFSKIFSVQPFPVPIPSNSVPTNLSCYLENIFNDSSNINWLHDTMERPIFCHYPHLSLKWDSPYKIIRDIASLFSTKSQHVVLKTLEEFSQKN